MMNWFKKKTQEASAIEPSSNGFYSTELFLGKTRQQQVFSLQEKLAISFQKGIESFKPVNEAGFAMDSSFAMDEQYPDLVQAKLAATRMQGLPEAQIAWYAGQGFIGWQTAAMLSQNWLIDKACTMPAKDACRNGYEVTINDGSDVAPEVLDYIRNQDKKFGINKNCVEFVRNGRIFGIRIAMFEVISNDPDYYTKPFNPDGVTVGSYKGISQIDPYWITPELSIDASSNPAARDFYEPTWWRINGKRVHRSHLVIMRNSELPDILKPSYIYGGVPIPQRIAERVFAAERVANEAPMLAASKRLTVLNIDITQAMANQQVFEQKLTYWTEIMNNYGVKVIGEGEQIQQFDTSLSDLDGVIMTQFQLVAAASGVPATKLLGTSPKGFNATGEFEEASYHEELESIQEHDLTPLVERHHLLLIRSHVCPKFNIPMFNTEVNWKPVDSPTAAEISDINLKKAQTDAQYAGIGALDGVDIRQRLIQDKDSGYNGIAEIVEGQLEQEPVMDALIEGEQSGGAAWSKQ